MLADAIHLFFKLIYVYGGIFAVYFALATLANRRGGNNHD